METTSRLPPPLVRALDAGSLVIMAGAGVSSIAPSEIPGWYALNARIAAALGKRVGTFLDREEVFAKLVPLIDACRNDEGFPPDYQAQILEEESGPAYFEALTAVDVDATNPAHGYIAELARLDRLRALVTTNFDRLLEHALALAGVPFEVAFEPASFARCLDDLRSDTRCLWIIKIHGCVQMPTSMIDTLKQRMLGRNAQLLQVLWRTAFGSGLHLLRHQRNDEVLASLAQVYVRDALARWVPEIELVAVVVVQQNAVLQLTVRYREAGQPAAVIDATVTLASMITCACTAIRRCRGRLPLRRSRVTSDMTARHCMESPRRIVDHSPSELRCKRAAGILDDAEHSGDEPHHVRSSVSHIDHLDWRAGQARRDCLEARSTHPFAAPVDRCGDVVRALPFFEVRVGGWVPRHPSPIASGTETVHGSIL